MAKVKVSDIAKEIEVSSKEVLDFLHENNIEAKVANSSIEESDALKVKKHFGKAPAESAAPAPKKEEAKPASASQDAGEQPKKKKKIIMVSNSQNSNFASRPQRPQMNNNRPAGVNNGNRPGQPANQAPVHRTPIKPLTPPSAAPEVDMKKYQAPKKVEETPVQSIPEEVAPVVVPAPAEEKVERVEKAERPEKQERVEKPERVEKTERTEKTERLERTENSDRPVRNNDNRNFRQDRPQNGNRPQRPEGGFDRNRQPRPEGGFDRNRQPRPEGGFDRNRQPRPEGGFDRNRQPRPEGGMTRPGAGNRPSNGGNFAGGRPGAPAKSFGGGAGANINDFTAKNSGRDHNSKDKDKEKNNKGFGQDGSKDTDKKHARMKDQEKRRGKEIIYDEDAAEKTNRPGRFIKPEKKVVVEEEVIKVITLPDMITIKDLADKMKIQPAAIVKKLFLEGKIVTVNQEITYEDAENIAMEYEILCEHEVKIDVIEELLKEEEEAEDTLVERPPVICVMGHVDHGKTSLLDAIRKTSVTSREAGGITQHIGAYTVTVGDRKITFLDTPGHEAFTAMRMRGANATDIAILVVAADDGVMPQTIEAINHAKAAGIEIIVAVNKIDKPAANIERVKQELTEYELVAEDWGGSTVFVPVSAKRGDGISDLLDMILLQADVLELKANPNREARGIVIEAKLDKGRGAVATVLVQKGTLHTGDYVSAGSSYGRVRALIDDKGKKINVATPSTPVEILGLSEAPNAGEVFIAHKTDKEAKQYAETYMAQNKEKKLEEIKGRMSLDDVFAQIKEGNLKELNIIVKADVQGSVEAVKQSLTKLSNEEVVVKVIHSGVGAINESDVSLATASNAIIIGFNVRPDAVAKNIADSEGVDVRLYNVIYQAIEDIEAAMKGMLAPKFEEKIIGHAEIRQIFKASAIGNIAGSYVLDGEIQRNCKVRITREGELIFEGKLASLKRFKDDVKEVKTGFECGLVFEGFDKVAEFDQVEAYIMVEVPR